MARWIVFVALLAVAGTATALPPARGRPVAATKGAARAAPKVKRSWQTWTVGPGDTLPGIASEVGCTPAELKKWNRLARDQVKPGMRLKYLGVVTGSESVGHCWNGSLVGGVRLPYEGRGYVMNRGRTRVWGTPETVRMIKGCMSQYRSLFKKGPPVNIGDLSARTGGAAPPHVSHESGRDVDIGFITRPPQSPGNFDRAATPQNLDVEKQWAVTKCFLDLKTVQAMFIEWPVVEALKAHVQKVYRKNAAKRRHYLSFFPGGEPAVLKADGDHRTHMHVRFKCPKGDRRCLP